MRKSAPEALAYHPYLGGEDAKGLTVSIGGAGRVGAVESRVEEGLAYAEAEVVGPADL